MVYRSLRNDGRLMRLVQVYTNDVITMYSLQLQITLANYCNDYKYSY